MLLSLFTATTLRERYYIAQERLEILETAISDIDRINRASENNKLIKGICDNVRR